MVNIKGYTKKKKNESNAMGLGLSFIAGVGIFFYFGHLADNYFSKQFTFKMIGLFLGIFGATVKLLKDVKKIDESNKGNS